MSGLTPAAFHPMLMDPFHSGRHIHNQQTYGVLRETSFYLNLYSYHITWPYSYGYFRVEMLQMSALV
jgi:hypothetical protein